MRGVVVLVLVICIQLGAGACSSNSSSTSTDRRQIYQPLALPITQDLLGVNHCPQLPPGDEQISAASFDAIEQNTKRLMASNQHTYIDLLPGKRTLSVCISWLELSSCFGTSAFRPHVHYYGYAFEQLSLNDAETKSMSACRVYEHSHTGWCTCIAIKNDDGFIEAGKNYLLEKGKENWRWIRQQRINTLETTKFSYALFRSINEPNEPNTKTAGTQLSLSEPVVVGYPDTIRDYNQLCLGRYSYALKKIAEDSAEFALINKFANGTIFGCHWVAVDTVRDYLDTRPKRMYEQQCKFVARSQFTTNPITAGSLIMPENLSFAIKDEVVIEFWGQGLVRANGEGFPLAKRELTAPLAIRTNRGLYLGVEALAPDPGFKCSTSTPLATRLFDVEGCGAEMKECGWQLRGDFATRVQRKLAAEMKAELDRGELYAPGSFGMKRQDRKSIFGSSNQYERSGYLFQSWNDDDDDLPMNVYVMSKLVEVRGKRYIYAKLTHNIQIASNRAGPYVDNDDILRKYKSALSRLVTDAHQETCAAFGQLHASRYRTTIANGVCKISRQNSP